MIRAPGWTGLHFDPDCQPELFPASGDGLFSMSKGESLMQMGAKITACVEEWEVGTERIRIV